MQAQNDLDQAVRHSGAFSDQRSARHIGDPNDSGQFADPTEQQIAPADYANRGGSELSVRLSVRSGMGRMRPFDVSASIRSHWVIWQNATTKDRRRGHQACEHSQLGNPEEYMSHRHPSPDGEAPQRSNQNALTHGDMLALMGAQRTRLMVVPHPRRSFRHLSRVMA